MSRSEAGVMNSDGLQAANTSEPVIQNMHLGYGVDSSCIYKVQPSGNADGFSVNVGMSGVGSVSGSDGVLKNKRGRPRKYGPDGSIAIPLSAPPPPGFTITHPSPPLQHQQLNPPPHPPPQQQQQHQQHSGHQVNVTPVPAPGPAPGSPQLQPKKPRGRPPGATNKKHHLETLGSLGIGFTPHVIIVKAGEDVSSRIMSFSQNGPRAICILSANGALSSVTLRPSVTSGGSVTYEGRFEILTLSGSFMHSDKEGNRSRSGGLSISLAGPDGRIIGGGVAGLLIAASPVQVVVASFFTDDGREEKSGWNEMEPMSKLEAGIGPTGTGGSSPTSRGTPSESSGSPVNQAAAGVTINSNDNPNMQQQHGLPWM